MSRAPTMLFVNLRPARTEAAAAIVAARRQGLGVALLADKRPPFPLETFVDVEIVDTFHRDRATAAARDLAARNDLRGIVTWSDRDVELVSHLGTVLGLPAPEPAAARRARHKFEMKETLSHVQNLLPRYARVRGKTDLERALEHVGLPAVLKPVGASGSKGIFELRTDADAVTALDALGGYTRPEVDPVFRQHGSELIVEEFLVGPEVSVEGWVSHGRVVVVGITDKLTTDPWHLELQHIHPARRSSEEHEDIVVSTERAIRGLDLDHCAFHLEGKVTPAGFRFIEVAARTGGDYIGSHLIPRATGIDFYGGVIRVATGVCADALPQWNAVAGVRFVISDIAGRLVSLGLDAAFDEPWIDCAVPELPLGSAIRPPPADFISSRVAAVFATAPDHSSAEAALAAASAGCAMGIEAASRS